MKRKRIQYNELNEEIYAPIYWTKLRLIILGLVLLPLGFLINLSPEEKLNKFLQTKLSNNVACPVQFEKAELSYFLPKIIIKKPVIMGSCFGQYNNQLSLKDISISFHSPSFYPLGVKLHLAISSGRSKINLFPVLSVFSQYLEIEKTMIDGSLFAPFMDNNISPISGMLAINGLLKIESSAIVDGMLEIKSSSFGIPAQVISNFEIPQMNLETFQVKAHFVDRTSITIDNIRVGKSNAPIELNLKGQIAVNESDIMGSIINLNGTLKLTTFALEKFDIIKIFLPTNNTSGTYGMKLRGPLRKPGQPQFN